MERGGRISQTGTCVDTVRVLHQTIISLKAALEQSRSEIVELKAKAWPVEVEETLRSLSSENYILRQKLAENHCTDQADRRTPKGKSIVRLKSKDVKVKPKKHLIKCEQATSDCDSDSNKYVSTETIGSSKVSKSLENLSSARKVSSKKNLSKSRTISFSNISYDNRQVSITNSFDLKSFPKPNIDAKNKLYRKSCNGQSLQQTSSKNQAKKVKNLQFSEEFVDKGQELCLSQPDSGQISQRQRIATSKSKKKIKKQIQAEDDVRVVKSEELLEQNLQHSSEDVQIEPRQDANDTLDSVEFLVPQETESHEATDELETKELHTSPAIADDSETEASLDNHKSAELGKLIEDALFPKTEVENSELQQNISSDILVEAEIKLDPETGGNLSDDVVTASYNDRPVLHEEGTIVTDNKEEKENEEKEKDDTDTLGSSDKVSSSENSTEKTFKNVEISVKIFKGTNKKPIEVDIQTKTFKRGKKKAEMNDKSQNTSFENDGIPPLTQIGTSEDIVENLLQNDAEQEVDDIELIFTTDDTKDTDFKEELVSIEPYASTQLLQCPQTDYDDKADVSDRELEDDVFNDNFENENQENCGFQSQSFDFRRENSQIYNSKSDNSINHEEKSLRSYYSYQDSSFENKSLEKDESFDRFEEKIRIVETDISKVGIQDVDYNMGRRNTCPNPLQYRPIMHREALGRGLNSRKSRPILAHSNVVRKECGAQTDISAIPGSSWRSESSLAHKVKIGENFTTLPSKFPHPGSKLRLSEKTVEARRVLLSDIGFTSMVPELSRSADHLCPPNLKAPTTTTYGQFLRTSDLYSPGYTSQKFVWTTTATPSEGSHSQSRYSSHYPLSPPAPTRRCSAPVSPSRRITALKSMPSRVRFANGSLPELRGDWTTTVDSGESTDSLVEEAEHFLRRSIDCLAPTRDVCFRSEQTKSTVRRASAPEPSRDNVPPSGWQPFLPRVPRDLHLDYWVKVISQEGRVRGGRVRYVGPLMSQADSFVGVQLSTPDGHSDGTFNTRRYFNCEPYHGIFVPFKKIIMGWRP